MKKILVISGSHQKKGTGIGAFNIFKEYFNETEYSFEVLHLSDYNILFCKGCKACFKVNEKVCPCKDDVLTIVEKMKAVDALIFISPIYGMGISGQLKTFLDRIVFLFHRPALYRKQVLLLFSTDIGGIKPVSFYMRYLINGLGMYTVGTLGVLSGPFNKDDEYRNKLSRQLEDLAVKFKKKISLDGKSMPKFSQLVRFNVWKLKNTYSKDIYPGDFSYWKENGWFEADYYYPVKLKPFQKFRLQLIKLNLTKILRNKL